MKPVYIESHHLRGEIVDEAVKELQALAFMIQTGLEEPTACQKIVFNILKDAGVDFNTKEKSDG